MSCKHLINRNPSFQFVKQLDVEKWSNSRKQTVDEHSVENGRQSERNGKRNLRIICETNGRGPFDRLIGSGVKVEDTRLHGKTVKNEHLNRAFYACR